MKFAGIVKNDTAAAPGMCVSVYTQGCPHHCVGCHNPETWDFNGGKEFTTDTINTIIQALTANGVQRNLCILGGEPLCEENTFLVDLIIDMVKKKLPEVKVYIWSGYYYEQLKERAKGSTHLKHILSTADYLVDGPFIQEQRDITLKMRGSANQNLYDLKLDKRINL